MITFSILPLIFYLSNSTTCLASGFCSMCHVNCTRRRLTLYKDCLNACMSSYRGTKRQPKTTDALKQKIKRKSHTQVKEPDKQQCMDFFLVVECVLLRYVVRAERKGIYSRKHFWERVTEGRSLGFHTSSGCLNTLSHTDSSSTMAQSTTSSQKEFHEC